VQLALEPIYEGEFYDFSYGFRPGKSAHQCLNQIWKESMGIQGGYIIDMDISKYFYTIPHEKLREILGQRVSDGVIQRIIGKWLNAGIMEAGNVQYPDKGTPPWAYCRASSLTVYTKAPGLVKPPYPVIST
jgi:retron-type reverse transcriptase